jgi:hypothetical protein
MQLALAALEHIRRFEELEYGSLAVSGKAVAALKTELATPEPEPVAWINATGDYCQISRPDTVYGSHTIPLYRRENL